MKAWVAMLCVLAACAGAQAKAEVWQPVAGQVQLPLWPGTPPDAQALQGPEAAKLRTEHPIAGKPWLAVSNVSRPTLTVHAPQGRNRRRHLEARTCRSPTTRRPPSCCRRKTTPWTA